MACKIKCGEKTLSSNGTGSISIEVDAGKTFTIGKIATTSTGDYKITQIKDSATGYHFISGSLYRDHIKERGNHLLLYQLVPIVLRGPTKLILELTDLSGSSNTVKLAFIGDES